MRSNKLFFFSFSFFSSLFLKSFFINFLNVLSLVHFAFKLSPNSSGDLLACCCMSSIISSLFGTWVLRHLFLCCSNKCSLIFWVFMQSVHEKRCLTFEWT